MKSYKSKQERWLSGWSIRPVSGRSWTRSPTASYQRRLKMVPDASLLNALLSNLVQK